MAAKLQHQRMVEGGFECWDHSGGDVDPSIHGLCYGGWATSHLWVVQLFYSLAYFWHVCEERRREIEKREERERERERERDREEKI
jgi:hypothetical protein